MKKLLAVSFALVLVLSACAILNTPTPIVLVVTATNEPVLASSTPANTATFTPSPMPTDTETPVPTDTPSPTVTPSPTLTSTPTPNPVTIAQLRVALQIAGYSCHPFTGINDTTILRPGEDGYSCSKENVYETIKYYTDGYVRLEVLNDPDTRVERMELKFRLLDELFPADFMAALRQANAAYAETAPRSVSGDAVNLWPPPSNDWWNSIEGQYNVSSTTIGTSPVSFSLWFWQITCPDGYICWLTNFPGEVFIGQNSLVFYDIELNLAP
jgi:hypothetical protein